MFVVVYLNGLSVFRVDCQKCVQAGDGALIDIISVSLIQFSVGRPKLAERAELKIRVHILVSKASEDLSCVVAL